jgi:hypothetical protein
MAITVGRAIGESLVKIRLRLTIFRVRHRRTLYFLEKKICQLLLYRMVRNAALRKL